MDNGSAHFIANYDNRNKIIWNNTHFRLFNRDNPTSLDIMQLEEIPFKSNKDREFIKGFDGKMPHEIPEVR